MDVTLLSLLQVLLGRLHSSGVIYYWRNFLQESKTPFVPTDEKPPVKRSNTASVLGSIIEGPDTNRRGRKRT